MLLGLGNGDGQDSVVKRGLDLVRLDAGREVEGARELADAALRDPVLGLGAGRLLRLLLLRLDCLGDGGGRGGLGAAARAARLRLILDGGLVGVAASLDVGRAILLTALGDGAAHVVVVTLEQAGGGVAFGVGALDLAADHDGLRVGELDVHVLLLDAGQLAVQLVGCVRLPQVELGREGRDVVAAVARGRALGAVLRRVLVKVVDQAEETREVGLGGRVEAGAEQRHVAACGVWIGSRDDFGDVGDVARNC